MSQVVCGPQPVLPTDKFADSALEALKGLKVGWSWQNVLDALCLIDGWVNTSDQVLHHSVAGHGQVKTN